MATISGILNNLTKANQRIEDNTTEINTIKQDYVVKEGNATPVTESVTWEVTETGALKSTEIKRDVSTGQTSTITQMPIPVTDTKARLIQPAEIDKINTLNQWYETNNGNALNYAVDLTDAPNGGDENDLAVQTYLTAKFNAVSGITGNPTQDLVSLKDENTGAKYVWYVNHNEWRQSNSATGAQATNETHDADNNVTRRGSKGVIMGSDTKGKMFIEPDGTASLVGYDEMVVNIENNAAAAAAKYTKPATGIPDTDLTAEVQASLEKANTALQSVPDATDTVKGVATLGATGGAARYGEKADAGLGNVDNTSDVDKPVSNAMQAALNAKQNNLSETQLANIAAVPNKADTSTMTTLLAGKADIVKGTQTELENANAIYNSGTFVWDSTRGVLKIADGSTRYKKLNRICTEVDLPKSVSFAADSWATIAACSEAGMAQQVYSVGDRKSVSINGTSYNFVIYDFNHDDLEGGGKAGITIALEDMLATTYRMNSSNTNSGGWNSTEMRNTTLPTILGQLPSDLQAVIKPVIKTATSGSTSTTIQSSTDKLFLFSEIEISGTTTTNYTVPGEGSQYKYWKGTANGGVKDGTSANDRIKYLNGTATRWWLRSPNVDYSHDFCGYYTSGNISYIIASSSYGVCFGFCV